MLCRHERIRNKEKQKKGRNLIYYPFQMIVTRVGDSSNSMTIVIASVTIVVVKTTIMTVDM